VRNGTLPLYGFIDSFKLQTFTNVKN